LISSISSSAERVDEHAKEYFAHHHRNKDHPVQTASAYKKPGAAIQFEHDYDGYTELNTAESIRIRLTEQYDIGVLTVTVIPEGDVIQVSNNFAESFSMQNSEPHYMDVEFSVNQPGKYSLYLQAAMNLPGNEFGEITQSFALQINVGEVNAGDAGVETLNAKEKQQAVIEPSPEKIETQSRVFLPAIETIIQ